MKPKEEIRSALSRALGALNIPAPDHIVIEHPGDMKNGDYATSIALVTAKAAEKSPREVAEALVEWMGEIPGIASIDIAGPGFINFHLDRQSIAESLDEARREDVWGANDSQTGKTILMEYTDPNPFKEFHIGHLVPNAIGEAISRLQQFTGADVKRANYQGDVGVHVAKSLYVLILNRITDPTIADLSAAYPEGSKLYEEDADAKTKIDALNKIIYDKSDASINALYEKGRELSLQQFEVIYKILGTKFDFYFFESETAPVGVEIVRAHPEIFVESDGAVIFRGEEYGLHTRVFINRLGLPTYEAKELGLVQMKKERTPFDLTMTITANEQKDYFHVVMKAMELVFPDMAGKLAFRTHGLLRFAEGKMSSRTGNIIRGEDLIRDLASAAKERASESRAEDADELATEIAIAAIKYQILKQVSSKDIIFDRERALSLEGDSGPYLQYAHARTHQILEKANEQGVQASVDMRADPTDLTRLIHRFPEVVAYAAEEFEPHFLTSYLLEVASMFNSWYAQVHILDGTPESAHKVAVTDAVRKTLLNGLWILGIPTPEKM